MLFKTWAGLVGSSRHRFMEVRVAPGIFWMIRMGACVLPIPSMK
ncbi:MAG: hypothetical protein OES09_13605 [Gammaproteobacteria bacterium]|nr:hypothetical protein [Gammaproteobacteria bacterium]